MMRRNLRGFLPVLLFAGATTSSASGQQAFVNYPTEIRRALVEADEICRRAGGTRVTLSVNAVRKLDLNGDGREDYIVDFHEAECVGRTSFFCGTGGCDLLILVALRGGFHRQYITECLDSLLLKNRVGGQVGALTGLTTETLLLAPVAGAVLIWLEATGRGSFGANPPWQAVLLAMVGVITVSPLLLFAEEIDPRSGRHLGNFPQAFTHLALINAVMHVINDEQATQRRVLAGEAAVIPWHP